MAIGVNTAVCTPALKGRSAGTVLSAVFFIMYLPEGRFLVCIAVYTLVLQYVKYKLDLLQEFGLLAILKAKRWREYVGYELGREVLREHAG